MLARLLHGEGIPTRCCLLIMLDRLEQDLRFTRNALGLRAYRQELLASNIANADTPNFKARDLDFRSALNSALGNAGGAGSLPDTALERTHAGHLPGMAGTLQNAYAKYRTEYMGAVDGNTVNMDVERAAFTENSLQMEAMMTFVNSRLRTMNAAIQSQ